MPILTNSSCDSMGCIYIIFCLKCDCLYIGETSRSIKTRILEHLRNIKKFGNNLEYSLANINKFQEIAIHFNERGHPQNDFKFCVFEANVTNNEIRKSIETDLINLCLKVNINIINDKYTSSDNICYFTFQNKF